MVERIENPESFESLRAEWGPLLKASRSDCLFLTWEWLHTWWKHLAGNRQLSLLQVRSGSDLVALAPLTKVSPRLPGMRPWNSLEFLGSGKAGSDYLDFIIHKESESRVLPLLADYLVREKALVRLSQVDHRVALTRDLAALWQHRGYPLWEAATAQCPVICLKGHTWESYLATLSSEHRYNFRRKLRKLTGKFSVRFELVGREEQRPTALARLVALHSLRWQSCDSPSSAFHTPALLAFHEEITRLALQKGWLRLFTLWLDKKPAAALYGFFYNNVFYFYQSGFDPAFSQYSVGLVAMGLAIQSAIDEGATHYDLLQGTEEYKFSWATDVRELSRYELYPSAVPGAVCKTWRGLNGSLRRVVRDVLHPLLGRGDRKEGIR